jgi:hypothetical protein
MEANHALRRGDVRRRTEEEPIDDAEHDRVGPDPERERRDDDRGEARPEPDPARRVAEILEESVEPLASLHVSLPSRGGRMEATRLVVGAETAEGLGARLVGAKAAPHELLDAHVEVEADLLVDVALETRAAAHGEPEEAADARADPALDHATVLCAPRRGEDSGHRLGVAEPARGLGAEVGASRRGGAVVARTAVVRRDAPLRLDEAALLHAMQRLIEGAVVDIQRSAGPLLEPRGDLEAVHRTPGERAEHEHVERSLDERQLVGRAHPVSPLRVWREYVAAARVRQVGRIPLQRDPGT